MLGRESNHKPTGNTVEAKKIFRQNGTKTAYKKIKRGLNGTKKHDRKKLQRSKNYHSNEKMTINVKLGFKINNFGL